MASVATAYSESVTMLDGEVDKISAVPNKLTEETVPAKESSLVSGQVKKAKRNRRRRRQNKVPVIEKSDVGSSPSPVIAEPKPVQAAEIVVESAPVEKPILQTVTPDGGLLKIHYLSSSEFKRLAKDRRAIRCTEARHGVAIEFNRNEGKVVISGSDYAARKAAEADIQNEMILHVTLAPYQSSNWLYGPWNDLNRLVSEGKLVPQLDKFSEKDYCVEKVRLQKISYSGKAKHCMLPL